MPRSSRLIDATQPTVYHVMSRTALDGLPFDDVANDQLLALIRDFSRLYFAEILGFCLMGNHFHILVRMHTDNEFSDSQIKQRYVDFHGSDTRFSDDHISHYRKKWSSLSEFVKAIKQTFSRSFNKLHHRRGTLWGERFKSLIVEDGETLINCLAYIDLNPIRAGIVKRPEDYRWSSLGYHLQNGFALNRMDRFRYRTRYFTDSGIIGTKAFVAQKYQLFKHLFQSKHDKIPKPIKGLNGVYSLKRLSEAI